MCPSYMQQNPQSTMKINMFQTLKKVSKFLLSVYVLSIFFSDPSWISLFFYSFISHISRFPSQILSHIDNKNYIFLLCNAILVILAKSSSKMISSSRPSPKPEIEPEAPPQDTLFNENSRDLQPMELVTHTNEVPIAPEAEDERETPLLDTGELIKYIVVKDEYAAEKGSLAEEIEDEEQTKEEEIENEENCSDEEESAELYGELEEDQAKEGSIARMSTEELNRKFDEFIRRMKEEIRIEGQQQLVMV